MKDIKRELLEEIESLEKRSVKVLTFKGDEKVLDGMSYGMKVGVKSLKSILTYIEDLSYIEEGELNG